MSPREAEANTIELIKSDSMILLSNEDSPKEQTRATKVKFASVEIRDYNRIVGDHPDVKVGPPMSIGWEYSARESMPLNEYEETRPRRKVYLRMSSVTRKNMLHNVFGIPEEEIAAAEQEVQKIKRLRDHSVKQGKTSAKVESGLLSFRRKLRRNLSLENMVKGMAVASGNMLPNALTA